MLIIFTFLTRFGKCPVCNKRMMGRHCGPLYLSGEDVPRNNRVQCKGNSVSVHSNNENGEKSIPEAKDANGTQSKSTNTMMNAQRSNQSDAQQTSTAVQTEENRISIRNNNENGEKSIPEANDANGIQSKSLNTMMNAQQSKQSDAQQTPPVVQTKENQIPIRNNNENEQNDVSKTSDVNGGKRNTTNVEQSIVQQTPTAVQNKENQDPAHNNSEKNVVQKTSSNTGIKANVQTPIDGQSIAMTNRSVTQNVFRRPPPIRRKTIDYVRNVRIPRDLTEQNPPIAPRRSNRIAASIQHFNYGAVKCVVCKKTFRENIAISFYDGNIVCSFDCYRKANQ